MIRKRKRITAFFAAIIFIITTVIASLLLINSDGYLKSFSITSLKNVGTKYTVSFEKVKAAKEYEIVIYDELGSIFYNETTTNTSSTFDLNRIEAEQNYEVVVFAYDKNNKSISSKNHYAFTYNEPTISSSNGLIIENDKDYDIEIDGDIAKKEYILKVEKNNNTVFSKKITSFTEKIPKESLTEDGKYIVGLYSENTKISELTLYKNENPITDITIEKPANESTLSYNDVALTFNGGENAEEYQVTIYRGKQIIFETSLRQTRAILSKDFFNLSDKYKIVIKGVYGDYNKEVSTEFTMNEKLTLMPTYINKETSSLKLGSEILLSNPNKTGDIYYTTDGSEPTIDSAKYTNPIKITKPLTIKTLIVDGINNNSIIETYDINPNERKELKVYLSPSNQDGNYGVSSTGYTNEEKEMNDLTNYIEKELKKHNVKVYRNNPYGNINLWVADSRYYGADLHIAIHSNASEFHDAHGIETWINEETSTTYDLANVIQSDLMSIYFDKDEGNRGVKYSNGTLGETRMPKFGILVEVAHHDDEKDAKWIMENKALIGETIAKSILKYYNWID